MLNNTYKASQYVICGVKRRRFADGMPERQAAVNTSLNSDVKMLRSSATSVWSKGDCAGFARNPAGCTLLSTLSSLSCVLSLELGARGCLSTDVLRGARCGVSKQVVMQRESEYDE